MKKIIIYLLSVLLVLSSLTMPAVFADSSGIFVDVLLNNEAFEISGGGCGSVLGTVAVKVVNPDGDVVHLNQIKSDENGEYMYSVKMEDGAGTGEYQITVADRGGSATAKLYYLSNADVAEIENAVNKDGQTADDVVGFLKEKQAVLGIDNAFTDEEYNVAAQMLLNSSESSEIGFNDISEIIKKSSAVFDLVQSSTSLNLRSVINDNSGILLGVSDEFNTYCTFRKEDRVKADDLILAGKPYADVNDFEEKFNAAVKTIAETVEKRKVSAKAEKSTDGSSICITGVSQLSKTGIVTIRVISESKAVVNLNQIKTDKNGSYTYNVAMADDAESGLYTIEVFGRGADEKNVCEVEFISKSKRDEISSTIYSANSVADVKAALNKYEAELTPMTEDEKENAAIYLYEQKPDGNYTYEEITLGIEKSQKLINDLKPIDWTDADAFFAANSSVLFDAACGYDNYKAMTAVQRNKICQAVMQSKPFNTISAFRAAFKSAMSNAGGSNGAAGGGGGGGGGGAGGLGGGIAVDVNNSFPPTAEIMQEGVNSTKKPFVDLSGFAWAEPSIVSLYNARIISPAEDKMFRPADSITREEFIKLLVCAFEIPTEGAQCSFTDVKAEEWYYPYVAAGYEKGIIKGYEDGSFGIGSKILRQDMAVMISRCAEICGVELTAVNPEMIFNDAAEIAEYAASAVKELQLSGIINGDENKNFRPNGNANRAEAAKVIAKLWEIKK